MRIAIDNPVNGGARFMTHRQALKYVCHKRAKWTSERTLRLVENDPRNLTVAAAVWSRSMQSANYDRIHRCLTIDEMKRVPIIQPERMLVCSGSGKVSSHSRIELSPGDTCDEIRGEIQLPTNLLHVIVETCAQQRELRMTGYLSIKPALTIHRSQSDAAMTTPTPTVVPHRTKTPVPVRPTNESGWNQCGYCVAMTINARFPRAYMPWRGMSQLVDGAG